MGFQNSYNLFISAHFREIAAAVLLLGAAIRLRRLSKKGLFLWDEAAFYREVLALDYILKFYRKRWKEILALRFRPDAEKREALVKEYRSEKLFDYVWYKILHTALTYISCKIFKRADFAMAVPSFAAGMIGITLAMWTGKLIGGPAAGVMAGLCLAVGGMHTLHSRSAEPEVGAAACLQAAALCSLLAKMSSAGAVAHGQSLALLAASGFFLCGLSLFNPAWIILAAPIAVFTEAVYAVAAGSGLASFAVSVSAILASVLATVMIVNIPLFINTLLFPENGVETTFHRYRNWFGSAKESAGFLKRKKDKGVFYGVTLKPYYLATLYPVLLLKTEGPAVLAMAAGAALMLFGAGPAGAFIVSFAALILGILTVSQLKPARAITIAMPFLAVYAGYFLGGPFLPAVVALPAALVIAAWGSRMGWRIGNLTSGIRVAAEYILSKGYDSFLCSSGPFSIVYGNVKKGYSMPNSYEAISYRYTAFNEAYLIIEFHEHFPSLFLDGMLKIIQKHLEPEFTVEDPCVTFYPLLAEGELCSSTLKAWDTDRPHGTPEQLATWNAFRYCPPDKDKVVRVFNITPIFSPKPGSDLFYDLQIMQTEKMFVLDKEKNKKVILDALREMLVFYPDDPMIKFRLAVMYNHMGRNEMAERYLMEIVMDERLPLDKRKNCATLLVNRELRLLETSSMDDQRLNLLISMVESGLITEDIKDTVGEMIFNEKVTRFFEAREYENAAAASEERLNETPDCPKAMFYNALSLRYLGNNDKSAELFQAALATGKLADYMKDIAMRMLQ